MSELHDLSFSCPVPIFDHDQVLLAHGGGGSLMQNLISSVFIQAFSNPLLDEQHDSTVLDVGGARIAFTTDSYVVQPLFFPGGDIGSLAVHGTVNDLAMSGARPLALSVGMIIEEGFSIEDLKKVTQSIKAAAEEAHVIIATGDTKVVNKGKGDGIYINTTGIGVVETPLSIKPASIEEGDLVLINGDIGRHGMAIMAVREGLSFESQIETDSCALADLVLKLIDAGVDIHCMRDCTRGGLAASLNEIAASRKIEISINESALFVRDDVQGACEILGFDPLYVANEGRFVCFVPPHHAEQALVILREHPKGMDAAIIGKVEKNASPIVTMRCQLGATRIIDQLSGEQLPRIC